MQEGTPLAPVGAEMIWVWLVVVLAVALVGALAGGVAWWWWRRRRRARRPARRAQHPLVLAHGFAGFDHIVVGPTRLAYFRGVAERLSERGAEVHHARVPPLASVAVRAERLAAIVRSLDGKVNLVAHSMGGLDARYAIARLGLADRVASLTTIGTPHRGTPIADLGADWLKRLRLDRALSGLFDLDALRDLTTSSMLAFNRAVRDIDGVVYLSVVARTDETHPLLWPAHRYLLDAAGDNDGLVPTSSQRWGEVVREIEADHWSQIGWAGGFDAPALFDALLAELRARGL